MHGAMKSHTVKPQKPQAKDFNTRPRRWAAASLAAIESGCPTSLCASFQHIRRVSASKPELAAVMRDEYRIARRLAYMHDFSEVGDFAPGDQDSGFRISGRGWHARTT